MKRPPRQVGDSPVQRVAERSRRRVGRLVVLLAFLAGGALFVREAILPGVLRLWEAEVAPRLAGVEPASARRVPSPAEAADPGRVPPLVHREELIEALQSPPPAVVEVAVRLGDGFRPAGFRIAAQSHAIGLTSQPPAGLRLPPALGSARFGLLRLQGGREYVLALAEADGVLRLHVDRNGNGDLGDDGPALSNEGTGRFAAALALPFGAVTGQPLDGTYDLWVYLDERRGDRLHAYSRTQLAGTVNLAGRRYAAVVADNAVLDADYTNDGIAVDLDGDGRFSGARELLAPGAAVELAGTAYRFRVYW